MGQEMSMTTSMALTEGHTETLENGRGRTRKCGNLGTEYCERETKMTQAK